MGQANYTCGDITNTFYALSGQVSPRLYHKVGLRDPWIAKTPRGEWPLGLGYTIQNMMLERTVTNDEDGDEWTNAAPSALTSEPGGPFNNCMPPPEVLQFGQTLRSMTLSRRNIQTDDFCINDLATDFQIAKVLNNMMDLLAWVTQWVWSNRFQNDYLNNCDHKVTEMQPGFDPNASAFNPATPPTSRLSQGTLEQMYQWLVMEGIATDGSEIGYGTNDMPILDLFTDAATSRDLIRQDPDLRMDFRWARPGLLLEQLGSPYAYNGFKHTWIKYPPRWEIVGGVYTRIHPFSTATPTTKGWKRSINPAYVYATYQTSFIHIPAVFTALFEAPPTNPGGKVKFDYASHMGEFQFLVIRDKKCNPRGEMGFFDALFASAAEPGHTEVGVAIMHLNCPPIRKQFTSCYS